MNQAVSTHATQGTLIDQHDGMLVLGLPGTDHQLHLQYEGVLEPGVEQRITGVITANARRVDTVHTGGRYIEPVYGRPRRLQGRIVSLDPSANTVTVDCGCPFVCKLVTNQKATAFTPGVLVSFDVERGAAFRPM